MNNHEAGEAMKKILVILHSVNLALHIQKELCIGNCVTVCTNGEIAAEIIASTKPDVLIIDILLPQADGITVLQKACDYLPDTVIAITPIINSYVLRTTTEMGVSLLLYGPYDAATILYGINEYLLYNNTNLRPQADSKQYLNALGFKEGQIGYLQIRTCIALYSENSSRKICADIYPMVAKLEENCNASKVEHNVRQCIQNAWESRDEFIWQHYFPGNTQKCPSNKKFITRMAEHS